MKHRRHPNFPSYEIYEDGTIINLRTNTKLFRASSGYLINSHRQRVIIKLVIEPKDLSTLLDFLNEQGYTYEAKV